MTFLLELKEKIGKFYSEHEKRVLIVFKFLAALVFLIALSNEVGYFSLLTNPFIIIGASVLCAFTPGFVTVLVLSGFWTIHMFSVSQQLGIVVLIVLLIMYMLFFRFCPKAVYVLLFTVFCCMIHIPYVVPVVLALAFAYTYIFAMDFGIIIYFIIHTVSDNLTGLTFQTNLDNARALSYISESFLKDKTMLTLLIVFSITFLLANIIRKSSASYAWAYAIITGTITQFIMLVLIDIWLKAELSMLAIVIGTMIGAVSAFIYNALILNMDYTKTEHLQFEDDEYYYYVKAVPKRNVALSNVKVTHINVKNINVKDVKEKNSETRNDDEE